MLASSAERVYWLARYLERSENLARLISVHMNMLFDLPRSLAMNWQKLLYITGDREEFYLHYQTANDNNVNQFLLTNPKNPNSLYSSVLFARENIRTSRHFLPNEAWEAINELYLLVKNNQQSVNSRRERVVFLSEVLALCQRFNGLLLTTLSHTEPYYFYRLGQNLERADMGSRILELAFMLLAEDRSDKIRQYEGILWVNVLKAQDSLVMYRQHVRSKVKSDDVLNYLLKDEALPRSISFCLRQMGLSCNKLPDSEKVAELALQLKQRIQAFETGSATDKALHQEQDSIQLELAQLHEKIAETWFPRL